MLRYKFVMPSGHEFMAVSPQLSQGEIVEFENTSSQYLTANPWRVKQIRQKVSIEKLAHSDPEVILEAIL
jgi:hypothetical protein